MRTDRSATLALGLRILALLAAVTQSVALGAPGAESQPASQPALGGPEGGVVDVRLVGDIGYAVAGHALYRFEKKNPGLWTAVAECQEVWPSAIAGATPNSVMIIGGTTNAAGLVRPALYEWHEPQVHVRKVRNLPSEACAFAGDKLGVCGAGPSILLTEDGAKTWKEPINIFGDEPQVEWLQLQWFDRRDFLVQDKNGRIGRWHMADGKLTNVWKWGGLAVGYQPAVLAGDRVLAFDAKDQFQELDGKTGKVLGHREIPFQPQRWVVTENYILGWSLGDGMVVLHRNGGREGKEGGDHRKPWVSRELRGSVGMIENDRKELIFFSKYTYQVVSPEMKLGEAQPIRCQNDVYERTVRPPENYPSDAQIKEELALMKRFPSETVLALIEESKKRFKLPRQQCEWCIQEYKRRLKQMEAASQPATQP